MLVCGKRPRELGRKGRLADAALSGEDEDLVPHGADTFADEGERGIGSAWGGGGACLLVWAAVAGVCLSREVGLGALGAVRGGGGEGEWKGRTGQWGGALAGVNMKAETGWCHFGSARDPSAF